MPLKLPLAYFMDATCDIRVMASTVDSPYSELIGTREICLLQQNLVITELQKQHNMEEI